MATIVPESIEDFPNVTPGELRLHEIFKSDNLPQEDYVVWYEPRLKTRSIALKPDFILWGNDVGLICVEVKDWDLDGIREWNDSEIIFKNGSTKRNPVQQVYDYVNAAMSELKKHRELLSIDPSKKGKLKFPCSFLVALPNISKSEFEKRVGKAIDTSRFIFSEDVLLFEKPDSKHLVNTLESKARLFKFTKLSEKEIDILRSVIFPRVNVKPLSNELAVLDREQEIEALKIGTGHRIIRGVAGSGKTLLVVYRAKLLKSLYPQYKILILCYNFTLRNYIRKKLEEIMPDLDFDSAGIDIYHFHDFAYNVIRNQITNGNKIISSIGSQSDWNKYQEELGNILNEGMRTMQIKENMYDAILVDECQDLTTEYLRFITHILNKDSNHLLIAIDPAQNLYGGKISWKSIGVQAKGRVKTLKRTYRNTKQILEFAHNFLPDTVEKLSVDDTELTLFPELAVRTGDRPELIGFENQSDLIRYILDKIIEARNRLGSFSSICLAFQSSKNISYYNSLLAELKDKKIPFSEIVSKQSKLDFDITKDEVKLMTIHGVKGYEFDTVFLIGLDSLKIPNQERLIFVGITRAANFLYIPFLKANSDNPYIKKLEDAYI